jgi:hypothetical protein
MTEDNVAAVEAAAPQVIEAPSDDAAMDAIWERMNGDNLDPEPGEEQGPEPEKAADQALEPVVTTPPDLPMGIKDKWAEIPESAREAVLSSHRDLSRKLADQGRVVQASKPVFDVLVRAAQEIPSMADMTPAAIAEDVFAMAQIQGNLATDPVRTILGIAQQYGAIEALRQVFSGQAPDQNAQASQAMMRELQQMRNQLQQISDPNAIEHRVEQTLATRDTERMVGEYAKQREYWGAVEPMIPGLIPIVQQRLGDGASNEDVLNAAYEMALYADPDLRAKAIAAAKAPAQPDPARTAAQMKAKSVNITSRPTKAEPMTEDQAWDAIWRKHRG